MIAKKLIPAILGVLLLAAGCKKDNSSVSDETGDLKPISATQPNPAIAELYNIGKAVAQLSGNADFRRNVYVEVAKRFDGDENVLVETMLDNLSSMKNDRMSDEQQQALRQKVNKLQAGTATTTKHYPQIYIPHFEELQSRKDNSEGADLSTSGEEPIVYVFWDGNEAETNEYPGYTMNANGELEKLPYLISEKYTQQHEVWVLSFNERIGYKVAEGPASESNARISGNREFVYQVQTDDLGYIEGWPAGDVELFLSCASAKFKLFEGRIPTINRSSMKDRKWANVNHFIFYWYTTPEHGTIIAYDWTEKDDGGDNETTITYTVPANNGLPGVTYSYKISNNDEHCVYQVVQFDDPVAPGQTPTIYGNQYLHWKMTNVP